jgi:hypothetical protein
MTAVGVVLGQGQGSNTPALLAAAAETAEQLVGSVSSAIRVRTRHSTRFDALTTRRRTHE